MAMTEIWYKYVTQTVHVNRKKWKKIILQFKLPCLKRFPKKIQNIFIDFWPSLMRWFYKLLYKLLGSSETKSKWLSTHTVEGCVRWITDSNNWFLDTGFWHCLLCLKSEHYYTWYSKCLNKQTQYYWNFKFYRLYP
jgi:hypothetical protein